MAIPLRYPIDTVSKPYRYTERETERDTETERTQRSEKQRKRDLRASFPEKPAQRHGRLTLEKGRSGNACTFLAERRESLPASQAEATRAIPHPAGGPSGLRSRFSSNPRSISVCNETEIPMGGFRPRKAFQ